MKNITSYDADKYGASNFYELIESGIYKHDKLADGQENGWDRQHNGKNAIADEMITKLQPIEYVTSFIFEQEPEFGEGKSPLDISQFPLEDILDHFGVYVSDFYYDLNGSSQKECYQEFGSSKIDNLKELRKIIGKHVYVKDSQLTIE